MCDVWRRSSKDTVGTYGRYGTYLPYWCKILYAEVGRVTVPTVGTVPSCADPVWLNLDPDPAFFSIRTRIWILHLKKTVWKGSGQEVGFLPVITHCSYFRYIGTWKLEILYLRYMIRVPVGTVHKIFCIFTSYSRYHQILLMPILYFLGSGGKDQGNHKS